MLLDVIRHGATDTNLAGRFNTVDEPLAAGESQRLRRVTIPRPDTYSSICVSPLRRCVETANALGLSGYQIDGRLSERSFGIFEDLTPAECRTRYRDEFDAFVRFDAEYRPEGGESRSEHFARFYDWLKEQHEAGLARVLAITHGGTLDFLYRMAKVLPLHGGDQIFSGPNAALSTFKITLPEIALMSFGHPLTRGA